MDTTYNWYNPRGMFNLWSWLIIESAAKHIGARDPRSPRRNVGAVGLRAHHQALSRDAPAVRKRATDSAPVAPRLAGQPQFFERKVLVSL